MPSADCFPKENWIKKKHDRRKNAYNIVNMWVHWATKQSNVKLSNWVDNDSRQQYDDGFEYEEDEEEEEAASNQATAKKQEL